MIDTIVLTIYNNQFEFIEGAEKFEPPLNTILNSQRVQRKCTQNPSKADFSAGIYKPRLTLTKRPNSKFPNGIQLALRIEFSVPKLMYKNNFDEVSENDFEEVRKQLHFTLREMGVFVMYEALNKAQVSAIHYGKNIVLTNHELPSSYITEISRANVSQIYDINRSDFRNAGHSYKFRTNNFEFTLYDKLKDLQQSKLSPKRSVEPDKFNQVGLFDLLNKKQDDPFEILRMEIRLNKRYQIKKELNRLGINFKLEDLYFQKLFSKEIARKVCLGRLEEIRNGLYITTGHSTGSITAKITQLLATNPDQTPRLIFEFSAFDEVVVEHGNRTARQLIDPRGTNWFRIKAKFENIQKDIFNQNSKINHLIDEIRKFDTVRLKDYPQLKLNNVN